MAHWKGAVVLAVAAGIGNTSGVSAQTTIQVPGDFATIQGAIDAAVNGDTVLV